MQKRPAETGCIAVTGATGLIGRRLLAAFARLNLPTRALLRSTKPVAHGSVITGSILSDSALQQLVESAETVVHLAGVAHTSLRSHEEEEQARLVNVDGTRRLVEASQKAGVRHFMLMSSAHVYRGQTGVDLDEESPTAGDTVYGAMKLEAERIALAAASKEMRVTILRPCLTYGPGVRFNLQSLLRALRKHYYVHVRGARVVRSLASVDTVASAVVHLLEADTEHTSFNVADRSPVDLQAWVDHLADLMQVRHPYTVPPSVMQLAATVGSGLQKIGLPAPVTRDSLRKLTSSFSINTDRLASTGFTWPETRETVMREMISAETGAFATSSD